MSTTKMKDTQEVSIPTIKVEEVSEKNLDMLNNSQSNCPNVREDLKSMKVFVSQTRELEPIQVVKRGNKFQVIDGISTVNFVIEMSSRRVLSTSLLDIPIPQIKFLDLNK